MSVIFVRSAMALGKFNSGQNEYCILYRLLYVFYGVIKTFYVLLGTIDVT